MFDNDFDDEDDLPIPVPRAGPHPNEALPISERLALGIASGSIRDGGVVPFPSHLRGRAILDALTDKERATHLARIAQGYRATVHEARHSDAQLLQVVVRYEHPTEPKQVRPLRYCGKGDYGQDLFWFSWIPGTKPLYGGERLTARPDAPVLVVEGEKTADAAAALFQHHSVITWLSGASAVRKADLTPLVETELVVWPDNDPAGRRAARLFAALALEAGAASAAVVDVPGEFPAKWDLADSAPPGVTSDQLRHMLNTARPMTSADASVLLRAPENIARARRLLGHSPGYSRVDPELATDALGLLDPNMRGGQWPRLARCWYYAFGQAGLEAFDTWSRRSATLYKDGQPAELWERFSKEEGFQAPSLAWLLRKAKRAGEESQSNVQVDADALKTAEIDALNESHAAVLRGGRAAVMRETYDPRFERYGVQYLKKNDFIDLHVRAVRLPGEGDKPGPSVPLGKLWFSRDWRRSFEGVVFAPGGDAGYGNLNLWRGFAVEPADNPEGWSRFKHHLLNHVAGGDTVAYGYILNWMAAGVQWLGDPLGVALVLQGPKGAGKTIVTELYGRVFEPHKFMTSISEDIVGKFNAHLEHTLLLGVEEAFAPQNRAADGTLKDLVTRKTLRLEDKFFSTWTARNHLRIIMTSNNDHIVRADGSERRYAVFEVVNPHQDSPDARRAYFGAMVEQMENGGYEAMLGELLARDISGWNAEAIPETAALRRQKLLNLANNPVQSWLHERLTEGVFILHGDGIVQEGYPWGLDHSTAVPSPRGAGRLHGLRAAQQISRLRAVVEHESAQVDAGRLRLAGGEGGRRRRERQHPARVRLSGPACSARRIYRRNRDCQLVGGWWGRLAHVLSPPRGYAGYAGYRQRGPKICYRYMPTCLTRTKYQEGLSVTSVTQCPGAPAKRCLPAPGGRERKIPVREGEISLS